MSEHRIFVTGATGYIGGRLVPALLERGHRVRCLVRSREKLAARPWASDPRVEPVVADAADAEALAASMRGCDAACYLIHSMNAAGAAYRARDRRLARSFGAAARAAGVDRVVYLGGLGETGDDLSAHLASRREVEVALREAGPPTTVLRAAMIIGSGSASFEILRALVERLPVMITPRWVATECQPIAVRDVVEVLVRCLEEDAWRGATLDVGGPDVATYRALMCVMADALGLRRRLVIPVPVLTPRLSSLWIHLVTPLGASIARPLAEGLRNRVVCRGDAVARILGRPPIPLREAIDAAVRHARAGTVATCWSDAGPMPGDPDWSGGTCFEDRREVVVEVPADALDAAARRIGGGRGYHVADGLWRMRGLLDRLVGGPGIRRGRRDPDRLACGDALDFWRVLRVDPGRGFSLRAEMKLPGTATLDFTVEPLGPTRSRLVQRARFRPKGLLGILYWYALVPLHAIVFAGMLRGIADDARRIDAAAVAARATSV